MTILLSEPYLVVFFRTIFFLGDFLWIFKIVSPPRLSFAPERDGIWTENYAYNLSPTLCIWLLLDPPSPPTGNLEGAVISGGGGRGWNSHVPAYVDRSFHVLFFPSSS